MFTSIFLVALLVGIVFVIYLLKSTTAALPAPDSLIDYNPGGATEILATDKDPATGQNVVLGKVYSEFKEFAPITGISQPLQDATVAIEDERFYNHVGIDIRGTGRAVFRDIQGHHMAEGGSTLTQQLARDVVLQNQKKTFARKIREALVAIELEKSFTKEQILEMYLNEVCYGNNCFGVKAAASMYFGKPLSQLTVGESALIAGLPQSPTAYDPFRHIDAALRRRDDVIQHMLAQHYITERQAAEALDEKPRLIPRKEGGQSEFKAPYFTNYALRQVIARFGKERVYAGGLKIYTTLNYKMQREAEDALAQGILDAAAEHVTDGALVCLEPRTGFIRAMVGGLDYKTNKFNNAVLPAKRQPGSSFKAIVYTTAFALQPKRFSPDTTIDDDPVTYGKPPYTYSPHNFEGTYEGPVTIERAFAKSINVVAVKVANEIGIQHVIDSARSMGITTNLEPNLSLALGAYPVSPLEMASAYSMFPNHGSRAHPMPVIKIIDGDGTQIESNVPQVDLKIIPEFVVAEMSAMMREVVEHGTAAGAKGIHEVKDAHGKTGTTSESRDAWFIGYTPELTTAVWVCNKKYVTKKGKRVPDYGPMSGVTGGLVCAPIWARFMLRAVPIQDTAGEPVQEVPEKSAPIQKPMVARAKPAAPAPSDSAVIEPSDTPASPSPSDNPPALPDTPDTPTGVVAPKPIPTIAAIPTPDVATTLANGESALLAPPVTQPARVPARAAPTQKMVTVSVCEDTGMLASPWCPVTLMRTFPANRAPHQLCTRHKPEPGDR